MVHGNNVERSVRIPVDGGDLEGELVVPSGAKGLVLFAHGSGSSRFSPRNAFVARVLHKGGIGTLLFDLLTEEEDRVYETRFDIDLLTRRLETATQWLQEQADVRGLGIGYFGASTGSAGALRAAADFGKTIQAVVSRGGRPDLAEGMLGDVTAPTLLIVGGADDVVIELNRAAYDRIRAEKRLEIVPGATHLFEEPGALEEVARLALTWFEKHLASE